MVAGPGRRHRGAPRRRFPSGRRRGRRPRGLGRWGRHLPAGRVRGVGPGMPGVGREGGPDGLPHGGRTFRGHRADQRGAGRHRSDRTPDGAHRGAARGRRLPAAVGPERGDGREARAAPPGAPGGRGGRRLRDDLLGGRGDRGLADGLDRVLLLRARTDRDPGRRIVDPHADRGAHGVRPLVRAGPGERGVAGGHGRGERGPVRGRP